MIHQQQFPLPPHPLLPNISKYLLTDIGAASSRANPSYSAGGFWFRFFAAACSPVGRDQTVPVFFAGSVMFLWKKRKDCVILLRSPRGSRKDRREEVST